MLYKILVLAGYKDIKDYIKDVIDLVIFSIILSYLIARLPIENSLLISRIVFLILLIYVILHPFVKIQKNKLSINKELPYFITFLTSLSTAKISRSKFFDVVCEAKEYRYLTQVMRRIRDLALKWRLGFAEAAKRMSKLVPSPILAEFLDRFSAVLEFGEDFEEFFEREEKTLMESYEVEYKKSLENMRIVQEMFLSVSVSIAFLVIVALFLPFFAGVNFYRVIIISVILFLISDIGMYTTYKFLVIEDRLIHDLKYKPKEYIAVVVAFILATAVSVFFFMALNNRFPDYPLTFKVSLALSPYFLVGYFAIRFDRMVRTLENAFPAFITSIGDALGIRGSSQLKALEAILVHDFGPLNDYIERLYRRIKYTLQHEKSWIFFAAETGSYLIARFSTIFVRATRLGADASKVAKIILRSFNKMLDLRKFRMQMVGAMRGMLYGAYIAFVTALYLGIYILKFIYDLFASIPEMLPAEASGIFGGLIAFGVQFDENLMYMVADIMTIVHAFVIAYVLKDAEGGTKFGMFLDFLIMLWIGTAISAGTRLLLSRLFIS